MPDWRNSSYGKLNPARGVSRNLSHYFSPAVLVKYPPFGIERIRHKLAESRTVGGFRRAVGSVRVRISEAHGFKAVEAGVAEAGVKFFTECGAFDRDGVPASAETDGDEPPFASLWP